MLQGFWFTNTFETTFQDFLQKYLLQIFFCNFCTDSCSYFLKDSFRNFSEVQYRSSSRVFSCQKLFQEFCFQLLQKLHILISSMNSTRAISEIVSENFVQESLKEIFKNFYLRTPEVIPEIRLEIPSSDPWTITSNFIFKWSALEILKISFLEISSVFPDEIL